MSRTFLSVLMQVFSEEGKDKVESFFDIPFDLRFRLENKNKMQTWAPNGYNYESYVEFETNICIWNDIIQS